MYLQIGILGIINELNPNLNPNNKSYITEEEKELLLELYGKNTIFNMPKNNDVIIPGIYILSKPLLINKAECLIITLEGLDKFSENLLFAHQLRNIIIIISSLVIYHGIDNLEITKQNFNNIFKYINSIKYSKNADDIPKEYMSNFLCEINIQTEEENNNSNVNKFNNKISNKKVFKSFELINKHNKSQKSLNHKIKWLNENFEIKKINNTELNGNFICDLMENICEKYNLEETPILEDLLENILLSKLNEMSEVILTQFKTKFNKFKNDNSNKSLNYNDLIYFYFQFLKDEGISNLCNSTIASMINLKNAERYLIKILFSTYDDIDMMFRKHKNKFEDLIIKFGNNMHYNNEPKNIDEMKKYIKTLAEYLKKNFIPIVSYNMFNFVPMLSSKVNKYIIDKLNSFVEFDEKEKNSVQKKFDEYNRILEENQSKEINLEQTIRDLKNKEREYLKEIEIKKKRYETLEQYLYRFENENQIKINDSQNKLNELIKENYSLKNKKLINNDEYSLNGIKSDFIFVKNKLNELKNNIINYNQTNLNLNSNNFEQRIKIFNDNLEQIMNNNFNLLNEYKEKEIKYKEELDKINLDMIKLKLELKEEQQKYYLLNKQLEEEKKNYENLLSLFNEQKELIKLQEEKMRLQII